MNIRKCTSTPYRDELYNYVELILYLVGPSLLLIDSYQSVFNLGIVGL